MNISHCEQTVLKGIIKAFSCSNFAELYNEKWEKYKKKTNNRKEPPKKYNKRRERRKKEKGKEKYINRYINGTIHISANTDRFLF